MTKLTVNEIKLVNAMRDNEYNDALEGYATWTFTAIDNSGMDAKIARGVISSLVQKGLVVAEQGNKKTGDDENIRFTEEGMMLFESADGEDCQWGGKKLLKVPAVRTTKKKEVVAEVTVVAFTGMVIGTFAVSSETKTTTTIKTAKGVELVFDKKTGVQTNAKNSKFANRILK